MRIVFNIGGSVLCPEGIPDMDYVKKLSKLVLGLKRKKHKIIVVTGGGGISRRYIEMARNFKPSEDFLDWIGILGTRMNAMILIASLGEHAYPKVVKNKEDLEHALSSGRIVVMGGTVPKQTTDAVTVAVAELFKADLIIMGTDVDGVYDKDPDRYKNAKLIKRAKVKDLKKIVKTKKHRAKPVEVIDPVAVKLLKHAKIRTIVLNGKKIENIRKAIEGKGFKGTLIGD
ncbi:MAG: UMP kinase [Candidatus Aenigmarchaeota archaeon]|nr:UMP kinase [Candidatus Aenigmarchaeota archaeon]NIP40099.1 UMP kinase [Candidatus Aenigmarchaeota archaeon]NIQ18176.1 UMP kinase [Candidatus Aenigmarchaeota archaeon]NIS72933.1 UMP kinase [Candidatus Aenigmarchaeota archaeon]